MKKQTKELQGKSWQELDKEAQKLKLEINKLEMEKAVNAPKDTNTIAKKKKTLAVLLTLKNQKKQTS